MVLGGRIELPIPLAPSAVRAFCSLGVVSWRARVPAKAGSLLGGFKPEGLVFSSASIFALNGWDARSMDRLVRQATV